MVFQCVSLRLQTLVAKNRHIGKQTLEDVPIEELHAQRRRHDALSFKLRGIHTHIQSGAEHELALLWQLRGAFSPDSRVESTALTFLITGDRTGA